MNKLPFLNEFLSYLDNKKYSKKTLYNYERDLKGFQNFLSRRRIFFKNINKEIIDDYKDYLLSSERKTAEGEDASKKLSHYSANRMLSALRAYLQYLINKGHSSPLFIESIKLIRVPKRDFKHAKLDDLLKLIECPEKFERNKQVGLRNKVMLEVLFSTGIRLSELLNLKRDQIKESGEIFIKGQNKKGRVVYLTPRAKKVLEKYLSYRKDDLPYVFIPYSGSHFKKKDKRITSSYIQRKIKQYREQLGLEVPISAQWLTTDGFASYLIEKAFDPESINSISIHESVKLTGLYTPAKSTKSTIH